MTYLIRLRKYRSTWYYFTRNPQGGGFGSNHCGSKRIALHNAMRGIPSGSIVTIETRHKEKIINTEIVNL